MTWRNEAAPIIKQIIDEIGTKDMKALRRALKTAYPFGPKKYYPYKVWCDEIKKQLKLKQPYRNPKQQNLFNP